MRIVKCVVLLSSLQIVAGCASKAPSGLDGIELDEDFVTDAVEVADPDQAQSAQSVLDTVDISGADISAVTLPAISDEDSDGVIDAKDNCADSASGVMVDLTGCEIVMGAIEGLNFAPGDTQLNARAQQALGKYVDALKRYPEVVVSVEGHTDNRGPAADNLELSKLRVLTVVEYMVSNGISPSRVKPYGFGESRPRAANATASGREQNRRIEIKVIEGLL